MDAVEDVGAGRVIDVLFLLGALALVVVGAVRAVLAMGGE